MPSTAVGAPSAVTTGLLVVSIVFPLLSAASIYLRYLARRKSHQPRFHADDAWIIVAWVTTLPLSALVWAIASLSGVDHYKVDLARGTSYSLELIWLSAVIVQFPLSTVKISILFFYKRIFPTPVFRVCVWIGIVTVAVWGLLFSILVLTQVDPISASWSGGRLRYNSTALGLAKASTSIVIDILVLCFPLPVISRLHMDSKRKVAISLIFWLGAFCCVAAIVRTVLLAQALGKVVVSRENIYMQSKQFIFLIIEPNCSIIAACLPCYGPLIAGGHGADSLVRAARSVFHLGSGSSDQSPWRSRDQAHAEDVSATDSHVELRMKQFPEAGKPVVHCVGGDSCHESRASPDGLGRKNEIGVTKEVTVLRQ